MEINITSKRIDCSKTSSDEFTCYRAVEFEITAQPKRDVVVDIDEVQKEIDEKKQELQRLHDQLTKEVELDHLRKEVNAAEESLQTESVDKREVEIEHLSGEVAPEAISGREYSYTTLSRPWTIGVSGSVETIPKFGEASMLFGLSASIERRFWDIIGVQIKATAVSDLYVTPSSNDTSTGPANGSQVVRGSTSGSEYSVALPIYVHHRYYLKPEAGLVKLSRTDSAINYGPLGTKTGSQDLPASWSTPFYGLGLGYSGGEIDERGRKFFMEIDAKKYGGAPQVGIGLATGLIFSF